MGDMIIALQSTPVPTILVLGGLVFLFLAVVGQFVGKITVPKERQIWAGLIGCLLLFSGVALYVAPVSPSVPTPTIVAAVTPDTPTRKPTDTPAPKPPTNTSVPEPITTPTATPAGKILFEEDFEDGLADGVVIESGHWQVIEDDLGNRVFEVNNKGLSFWPRARFGSNAWEDYAVEYRVKLIEFDISTETGSGMAFLSFREDYKVSLNPYWQKIYLSYETPESPWDDFAYSDYNIQPGVWYSMRIEANGTRLKVFLDGDLRIDVEDSRTSSGRASLHSGPNTVVQFDDIRVIALEQ